MAIELKKVASAHNGIEFLAMRERKGDEWKLWQPFEKGGLLRAAFALEARAVLAISWTEAAVYDFDGDRQVGRWPLGQASDLSKVCLSRDRRVVYLHGGHPCKVIAFDAGTFQQLGSFGPFGTDEAAALEHLHEQPDGCLQISAQSVRHKNTTSFGITVSMPFFKRCGTYILDPTNWSVEFTPTVVRLGKRQDVLPGSIENDRERNAVQKKVDAICAVALTGAVCRVDSLTPEAISQALNTLAAQIEMRGLAELVRDGNLIIQFDVAGRRTTEKAFFKRMVDAKLTSVVPALRRLITAYVTADVNFAHLWYNGDEGHAAFVHPTRALLLLDPVGARDIFLDYLTTLDDGHGAGTWQLIFGDFVKAYRLKSKDDVRLGIAVMLHELNAASGDGMWEEYSLLASARRLMNGAEFGGLVMAVMDEDHRRRLGTMDERWYEAQSWLDQTPKAKAEYFAERATKTRDTEQDLDIFIVPLLNDVPADDAFGRSLRKKLAERWPIAKAESEHADEMETMRSAFEAMSDGDYEGGLKKMFAKDFANASPDEQKLLDEIVKNSTKEFGRRR